jgi:hypothetical protein
VKRGAAELATLPRLLDEALDRPEQSRGEWIEQLSGSNADLRLTLRWNLFLAPSDETGDIAGYESARKVDQDHRVPCGTNQHVAAPVGV